MNRYQTLMQRINNHERILIDGATGTEVERRGVPQLDNAWNGGGALTHPDIVRQIHEDYIGCGVYAHSGLYVDPIWIFDSVISPEAYASAAKRWLARDIQVIGGCCGVGVEHIALLNNKALLSN